MGRSRRRPRVSRLRTEISESDDNVALVASDKRDGGFCPVWWRRCFPILPFRDGYGWVSIQACLGGYLSCLDPAMPNAVDSSDPVSTAPSPNGCADRIARGRQPNEGEDSNPWMILRRPRLHASGTAGTPSWFNVFSLCYSPFSTDSIGAIGFLVQILEIGAHVLAACWSFPSV